MWERRMMEGGMVKMSMINLKSEIPNPKFARTWQISLRSIVFLVSIAGPVAGGLAGTFGIAFQEVLFAMLVGGLLSAVLAVMAVVLAFVILSPLLVVSAFLRDSSPYGSATCESEDSEGKASDCGSAPGSA
jgi:hypothetical protein